MNYYPTASLSPEARKRLEERVGRALLAHRLHMEAHWVSRARRVGVTTFHIGGLLWYHWFMRVGFKMLGLYGWGQHNTLKIRVRLNRLPLHGLPPEFEGFTILQLSDLHLDANPKLVDAVVAAIQPLAYDIAVITGDFRVSTFGGTDPVLAALARLRPAIKGDVYAVMGNHDFIEMLLPVEALSIRFLMNEHVMLRRGNGSLCLAGVDDPHYYETDNIQAAAAHLNHDVPSILLSHSPEIYKKAAACGFDALLCGHTHGGQICLPVGIPVLQNSRAPWRMAQGAWDYQGMRGYTSSGTGSSGVDVRFWCPPEITLHTLTANR
ncbi:MAG: metallophosphoesterase [bacterium]